MLNHRGVENKSLHIEELILFVADHTHFPTTKHIQTLTVVSPVLLGGGTMSKNGKYYKKIGEQRTTNFSSLFTRDVKKICPRTESVWS